MKYTSFCIGSFLLLLTALPGPQKKGDRIAEMATSAKYWIIFTDKDSANFNPFLYFDPKAIERRNRHHLPLRDYTDWAVNDDYVERVGTLVEQVGWTSRWFNAVAVEATASQITEVSALPFVEQVKRMHYLSYPVRFTGSDDPAEAFFSGVVEEMSLHVTGGNYDTNLTFEEKRLVEGQLACMQAKAFSEKGIDGRGVRIAVFDAGFPGVDHLPVFEHLRENHRIVKTYDFLKKREAVYDYNSHGTMVLACIAGRVGGIPLGMATGAEFLLARTESATWEPFAEEEYWLAAAEWADQHGADIISSSLGYTYHRYFPENMDGKKSLVVSAASMAAAKGILVINAAGNDGNKDWKCIGTPADADSVLSIGGVNPETKLHITFSSFGPTADGRLKPNVCAYAMVVTAGRKKMKTAYGTSFATPLVSGFAACAWQTNRNMTNMQLFGKIHQSAHLYPYYDYAHGYGVPQASFFTGQTKQNPPTFQIEEKGELLIVSLLEDPGAVWYSAAWDQDKYFNRPFFFYHIENKKGSLEKYAVIRAQTKNVLMIYKSDYSAGYVLRAHFQGFTQEYLF